MSLEIACPDCGEAEDLTGTRSEDGIHLTCASCGHRWIRGLAPRCDRCGSSDMQPVPLAIVEKGRGTQLSVVGTRTVYLCSTCDAATLERYHRNRPNPLMPDELPTIGSPDDR